MHDLPENLFSNPVWRALHSRHAHFAVSAGDASRYPADVVPFAAVRAPTAEAMQQLSSLLTTGESVWIIGETYTAIPELVRHETLECLQMILPAEVAIPDTAENIVKLSDENAGEMVALTNVAFPGFFRQQTCQMGDYFGVRSASGELIAMGGERLKLHEYSEISGVCTHPAFRGQGLAASLMWEVARGQRRDGVVPWLHVGSANHRAIRLYRHMGFAEVRKVTLHRIALPV
jgi:predicted GNAT family acetyltransferase